MRIEMSILYDLTVHVEQDSDKTARTSRQIRGRKSHAIGCADN